MLLRAGRFWVEFVLNRHIVRSSLGSLAAAFIIDLGGRNMLVPKEFLDFADVLAVFQ
jgi:hypothetical protein